MTVENGVLKTTIGVVLMIMYAINQVQPNVGQLQNTNAVREML